MANRVPPVLRLAVLCEGISTDADGRPYDLFVPVHTLRFPPGVVRNYRPPTLGLYVQFQGGSGTYYLRVALRPAGGSAEPYETPPVEVGFGDDPGRVKPLELAIDLDELVFRRPGVYEVVVYANHVCLNDPGPAAPAPFPPVRVVALPADGSEGGVL